MVLEVAGVALWNELLRQARERAGISQPALAKRIGASEKTIRNYEAGRTKPERGRLIEISRTLKADVHATNAILEAAGESSEPTGPLARIAARRIPVPTLQEELASYTWPCLVVNERYEIVGWNEAANLVAELDFARDLPTAFERNLMRISAMPHFYDEDDAKRRVVNWEAVVSTLLGMYKSNQVNMEQPEEEAHYFGQMVNEIATKFGLALPRMMALWTDVGTYAGGRITILPTIWRLNDGTILRFNCITYPWNDFDALWAFDWFPADGLTWDWVGARLTGAVVEGARRTPGAAGDGNGGAWSDAYVPLGGRSWNELLRSAREGSGLTRHELERLSGVSENTLDKYEHARRRPARGTLLRLARAMQLDTAATNAMLTRAGFEPEPSDWALILAGMPRRNETKWYSPRGVEHPSWNQIQADIDAFPWPCIALDDRCEVAAQNPPSVRVIGLDIRQHLRNPIERNVVTFFISAFARERIVNWEEVATALIPSDLRAAAAGRRPRRSSAGWDAAAAELRRREPEAMDCLVDYWRATPASPPASRVTFPLAWRADDGEVVAFHAVVSWQYYGVAWAMDWHPADDATWAWLAASDLYP